MSSDISPNDWMDTITNAPGSIVYRDEDGWIGLPRSDDGKVLTLSAGVPIWLVPPNVPPQTVAQWQIIGQWTFTSLQTNIDFTGLGAYSEVYLDFAGIRSSSSGSIMVRLSTDGGATYYSGSTDYWKPSQNGGRTGTTGFDITNGATSTFTYNGMWIGFLNLAGVQKRCRLVGGVVDPYLGASTAKINALRIAALAGQFNAGAVNLLGR